MSLLLEKGVQISGKQGIIQTVAPSFLKDATGQCILGAGRGVHRAIPLDLQNNNYDFVDELTLAGAS